MIAPTGYSISDYGEMIVCEPRMSTYVEALKQAVTPGCTVIDIGAGFGVFALLACKFGAESVVAIETDSSIELLHELAQANGFTDRITIVRDLSTNFTPEKKADVIISDLRGTVPLYESHIPTIMDARERLLADGGKLLPQRDNLRIAMVHAADAYRPAAAPWSPSKFGIDLSAGRRFAINDSSKEYLKPDTFVSDPVELTTLDYRTISDPNIDCTVELTASHDSEANGLLIWFDAEIADGLTYSNCPGEPELVYGQMFLPLSEPIQFKRGETMRARIRAMLLGADYTWNWDCEVRDPGTGAVRHTFRQSTFLREVHVPAELQNGSNLRVPEKTAQMDIDRDFLDLVGEGRSLGDIAEALSKKHTAQLPTVEQALDHVANIMRRY